MEMNIKIGADISDLIKSIQAAQGWLDELNKNKEAEKLASAFTSVIKPIKRLEDEMMSLKNAIEVSTDPADIKRLTDQTKVLQNQMNNLKVVGAETSLSKLGSTASITANALGTNVRKGSNQASAALIDLGRIAQDAPFGFIAISNNLNPMLESFKRLKVETGSTGGALRALGSSLTGAGGLGLAISVLSAGIVVAQMGMSAWTRGFGSHKAAIDSAKDSANRYREAVEAVTSQMATEISKVGIIVNSLQNENLTRKEKINAINDLRKLNPQYFGELDAEKVKIENITASYYKYVNAISASIEARIQEKDLTDLITKRLVIQKELNKVTINGARGLGDEIVEQFTKTGVFVGTATDRLKRMFGKTSIDVTTNPDLFNRQNDFIAMLEKEKKLIDGIGTKGLKDVNFNDEKTTKAKKELETVDDVINKMRLSIKSLNAQFDEGILSDSERIKAISDAIVSTIQTLNGEKFKLGSSNLTIKGLVLEVDENESLVRMRQSVANLAVTLGREKEGRKSTMELPLSVKPTITPETIKTFTKELQDFSGIAQQFANELGVTIGEALGNALSGEKFDLFGSLFSVMGDALQQLGKAEIAYATSLIVLKNAFANPYVALGAGIAAIAAGTALKNSIPHFATGGLVGGTGNKDTIAAMLTPGEFVLNRAAVANIGLGNLNKMNSSFPVMPTAATTGFNSSSFSGLSGGREVVVLTTKIQGSDLLLIHERQIAKSKRNG